MAEGKLEFYCGSLGSGKTSFAFERALEHLLKGGTVVTNIDFYPDVIAKWMHEEHGLKFDPERLIRCEDGGDVWKCAVKGDDNLETMLLIDEAHVEHNARKWSDTTDQAVLFNTMARKLKIHVVYITQDINNVDKQFRRMAQMMWFCRNARHFQLFGIIRFPFNLFFRVPYVCGPGVQPKAMSPEITLRPMSWGMFNSHALVGRAAETFSVLAAAKNSPLEKLKRPPKPFRYHFWAPIIAAGIAVLT
jgi:thymidine kinase